MLTYRRAEREGSWPTKSAAVLAATSALAHPVRRSWTILKVKCYTFLFCKKFRPSSAAGIFFYTGMEI